MNRFAGKTALVTGAGRNIGAVIAQTLACQGATVAVHYSTSADQAAAVIAKIEGEGGKAFGVRADIATTSGVDGLVAALGEQLSARGLTGLDILVNNAAMIMEGGDTISQITDIAFDTMIGVNMKAPFFMVQRLSPLLQDGGRVINLSSRPSTVAFPFNITYAMAKAADQLSDEIAGPRTRPARHHRQRHRPRRHRNRPHRTAHARHAGTARRRRRDHGVGSAWARRKMWLMWWRFWLQRCALDHRGLYRNGGRRGVRVALHAPDCARVRRRAHSARRGGVCAEAA